MPTCAEVESDSAEEVVADEPVEVPDGQLDAAILQLRPAHGVEHERVVPGGVAVAPQHRALVRRASRPLRQQATTHTHTHTHTHVYWRSRRVARTPKLRSTYD